MGISSCLLFLAINNIFPGNAYSQMNKISEADSMISLVERMELELTKLSNEHDSVKAIKTYNLAIAYGKLGNFTRQFQLARQAKTLYENLGDDHQLAKVNSVLAMSYYNLGNFELSLKMQLEALKIRERLKDYRGLAGTWNNLGIVYQRLNQPDDAIESYTKALEYIKLEKLDFLIGAVQNNLGSLYTIKKQYNNAMNALSEAFRLHTETANFEGLLNTHINFGVLYTELGNKNKATENYLTALSISEKIGDKHGIAVSSLNLSVIYRGRGDYKLARQYAKKSIELSVNEGFRDIEMDDYQSLANIYNESGEYKKAFDYYKQYSDLKDSLFNAQANENMSKMRALYEADKKEQDNILLNEKLRFKELQLERRQATIYFAVILLAGFIILFVSIFKMYRQNKKALNKEMEMNKLISRFVSTVSHEFRTPLTGISSSVQLLRDFGNDLPQNEQERLFDKIGNSISDLKSMLDDVHILDHEKSGRIKINSTIFNFDDFCKEVIRDTLSLESGRNIQVDYNNIIGNVQTDRELLGHVISNIISNAVKYSPANERVSVEAALENGELKIVISDNGRGIPPEDIEYVFNDFYRGNNVEGIPGTGLGMSIVKNTLQVLGGTVHLESETGKGTKIEIVIPIREKDVTSNEKRIPEVLTEPIE